jgi:predicted N-acetyltransferase YhbS
LDQFDFEQIKNLTSLCFDSKDYIQNFPQVFAPERKDSFFFIKKHDQLVSFCSIYPTYFLSSNELILGYGIGSVCTHPEFRNIGLASRVLQIAEEQIKKNGADFIYLFSPKSLFYENLGYDLYGNSHLFLVENNNSKLANFIQSESVFSSSSQMLFDEDLISKVWRFIVNHSHSSESVISYLEFKSILKIQKMEILIMTQGKNILSVCFFHKGDDFENVIHGLYFQNQEAAFKLVTWICKREQKDVYLFPGAFSDDFTSSFSKEIMPSFYAKILNIKRYDDLKQALRCDKFSVRSLQGT